MPYVTCPVCHGSGGSCWGCNGNGIVEVTSDEEADVVRRGDRLVDQDSGRSYRIDSRRRGCAIILLLLGMLVVTGVGIAAILVR
jgi:hypothetical protein